MTVMCGLVEILMEMRLLDMEVQLMILRKNSFRTNNATPYWCFESSPQYQILFPRPWWFLQTLSICVPIPKSAVSKRVGYKTPRNS